MGRRERNKGWGKERGEGWKDEGRRGGDWKERLVLKAPRGEG